MPKTVDANVLVGAADVSVANPVPISDAGGSVTVDGATKDAGPSWTVTRAYTTSADMTTAAALTAAPTAGQKIVLDDIIISTDTAMLFEIEMETSANVLAAVRLPANGTVQLTLRNGLKGDAADKKLFGDASAAGNVYITCCYHSEA